MPSKLTASQPAPARFTGKPRNAKHTKSSKLNKAAERAQHNHHQTAISPSGASGRGRNPEDPSHPEGVAGRDRAQIASLKLLNLKLRRALPLPPAPAKKHIKIEEKIGHPKKQFFFKNIRNWTSKWTPKSQRIVLGPVFFTSKNT